MLEACLRHDAQLRARRMRARFLNHDTRGWRVPGNRRHPGSRSAAEAVRDLSHAARSRLCAVARPRGRCGRDDEWEGVEALPGLVGGAVVDVVGADDIVLGEVAADLHLDDLEGGLA